MKIVLVTALVLLFQVSFAQKKPVGIFQDHMDIGNPKNKGDASYDATTQTYLLKGAGYNIWFNRDEFHYLYNKIQGDFILTANFEFIDTGKNAHRKIGWMLRETTDDASAGIFAVTHGDGLGVLQWRSLRGAYMRDPEDEIFFPKKTPNRIMQLERTGKKIIMRVANYGEPLQEVGSHTMVEMPDTIFAGLFICSHDSDVVEQAKVWNVRIDKPVPNDYSPNPAIQRKLQAQPLDVGCRLETINVFDGKRKLVYESANRFEAPNWMPDGKTLLFNEGGSLYTIPVEGGTRQKLNTGDISNNNNDHGISFDGKMLAISSHRRGLSGGGSTVYVLPLAGGIPKLVTEHTPSYWHGWNPNNKEVVLVGQRNGSSIYNLYKISIDGGPETALTTNTTGHVDGPEYSPDGRYIYYNANPTGTMQLWRMKPDGLMKEQLTFDENNNWFPHISPDGMWIAYIAFGNDIDPNSHPSYKHVTLRLMPASGGAPRVIAYLYGGQGTLNAPSWSPDSKHIAFVSNSQRFVK